MSKEFKATEKFAPDGQMIVELISYETREIVVRTDEDRRTLVLGPSASLEQMDAAVSLLQTIDWHTDLWVAMISIRDAIPSSCIIGEVKPVFSDMSFEEWCSPEQVAKEYYNRQEKLRRRK